MQYLVSTKKQNKYIFAVIIGAIFNFTFNIVLIKKFSAMGAAITSVLAELLVLLIELYYIKKDIPNLKILKNNIHYIIFGLIMYTITYQIGTILPTNAIGSMLQVIIGIIIYGSLLLISKDKFILTHIKPYIKKIF